MIVYDRKNINLNHCVLSCFVNNKREMNVEPNFLGSSENVAFAATLKNIGTRIFIMHIQEAGCSKLDKLTLITEFLNDIYYVDYGSEIKIEITDVLTPSELLRKIDKLDFFKK